MKSFYYYILLIILSFSLLLLLWRYRSDKIQSKNIINQIKYNYEQLLKENEDLKKYFVYQNQILSKSFIISNIFKKISDFQEKSEYYLIVCFSKQNCGICMKKLIIDLNDFKMKTGFARVILIGDISENEFYSKLQIEKHDFNYIYNPEFFANKNEYFSYPLLFVIDSKASVLHLFIPDLLKDFNEIYFEKVLPNLILNKN